MKQTNLNPALQNLVKHMVEMRCSYDPRILTPYRHCSMIFSEKSKSSYNLESFGINHESNRRSNHSKICHTDWSIHAEDMALDRIWKKANRSKKIIELSLLVIRIGLHSSADSFVLSSSRPCISCLHKMINSPKYGYRIGKVYFSNEHGKIVCQKLRDLIREKQKIPKILKKTTIPKIYIKNFTIMVDYKKGSP